VIVIAVVVILAVPMAVSMLVFMAMPVVVPLGISMLMRRIHLVVPAIRNEVHRSAAGVVLVAVLGPVLFMARGYVQIERSGWFDDNRGRRRDGDYGVR